MSSTEATCWTLIRDAASGSTSARIQFASAYLPVVKAYLMARWKGNPDSVQDALQDVFVECYREGGILEKVDDQRPGGFRSFLFGVVRNVALRHESRRKPIESLPVDIPADDTGPAEAFDRAWAKSLLREAGRLQEENAKTEAATRRVELLKLRFQEGLPIREIAVKWGIDAAKLHHEYATARNEFQQALRNTVAFYYPSSTSVELDDLCRELIDSL